MTPHLFNYSWENHILATTQNRWAVVPSQRGIVNNPSAKVKGTPKSKEGGHYGRLSRRLSWLSVCGTHIGG